IINSDIEVTASPAAATTLLLYGDNRMRTGNLASTVLRVVSTYAYSSTLTVPDGFANAGVVRLDSDRSDRTTRLACAGTFADHARPPTHPPPPGGPGRQRRGARRGGPLPRRARRAAQRRPRPQWPAGLHARRPGPGHRGRRHRDGRG